MASKRSHLVTLRWIAVAMAGVEVVIHAVLVPSHLKETPYIGVLFIAATAILTVVLVSLLRPRTRVAGWVVGALTCAGMFVGFIVSRTIGLPDYNETWTSDRGLGLISLPPELIFIGAALYAVRLRRAARTASIPLRIEHLERRAEISESRERPSETTRPPNRPTRPGESWPQQP
jgi:Na+/proline symporter